MFLENLERLMSEKGWSKGRLSRESELPYTTVDGIYKKGSENIKLSTLKKLSDALGVSIDMLVFGSEYSLSEHEKRVIDAYRSRKEMKSAVDKLLGVDSSDAFSSADDPDNEIILAYRAACSEDGHPGEVIRMTDEHLNKLKNAPSTDEGLI